MADTSGRSKFLSALSRAQEEGHAVAIYAASDHDESYEVGFIHDVDSHDVTLNCLTSKGEPDGRRVYRLDDITRIDSGDAYVAKIELLYQYRDSVFEREFRPAAPSASLKSQLTFAMEHRTVVYLTDGDDTGVAGFVAEVGEDFAQIQKINAKGEPDGESMMLFDAVQKVYVGRRNEQVLEFLYRYHYELKNLLDA